MDVHAIDRFGWKTPKVPSRSHRNPRSELTTVQAGVKGEADARDHARQTGHQNFQEY